MVTRRERVIFFLLLLFSSDVSVSNQANELKINTPLRRMVGAIIIQRTFGYSFIIIFFTYLNTFYTHLFLLLTKSVCLIKPNVFRIQCCHRLLIALNRCVLFVYTMIQVSVAGFVIRDGSSWLPPYRK